MYIHIYVCVHTRNTHTYCPKNVNSLNSHNKPMMWVPLFPIKEREAQRG